MSSEAIPTPATSQTNSLMPLRLSKTTSITPNSSNCEAALNDALANPA